MQNDWTLKNKEASWLRKSMKGSLLCLPCRMVGLWRRKEGRKEGGSCLSSRLMEGPLSSQLCLTCGMAGLFIIINYWWVSDLIPQNLLLVWGCFELSITVTTIIFIILISVTWRGMKLLGIPSNQPQHCPSMASGQTESMVQRTVNETDRSN